MGFEIGQCFRVLDDADGTGAMIDLPMVTIHPNTATSTVPYSGWERIYPYNDIHGWYAMTSTGAYGPLLIGEVPATTFININGDAWFAGHATMVNDAGTRQYGFQWLAQAAVTANHNKSYVGNIFGLKVPISAGKTESSDYFVSYTQAVRDAGTDAGTMNGIFYADYTEIGHSTGANAPTTEYMIGHKILCSNEKGTINHLYGFESITGSNVGTTTLYAAFVASGAIGTESMGFWADPSLKEIWSFTDLTLITTNKPDYDIGSGRLYGLDANGDYYIDGFKAGATQRDGAIVELYNTTSSRTLTIKDTPSGGGASTHFKVYCTTGADLALGPKRMLHLRYRLALDSGNGGWIAWMT